MQNYSCWAVHKAIPLREVKEAIKELHLFRGICNEEKFTSEKAIRFCSVYWNTKNVKENILFNHLFYIILLSITRIFLLAYKIFV